MAENSGVASVPLLWKNPTETGSLDAATIEKIGPFWSPPLSLTGQTRHRQRGGYQKSPKCVINKEGVSTTSPGFRCKTWVYDENGVIDKGGVSSARHRQGGVNDKGVSTTRGGGTKSLPPSANKFFWFFCQNWNPLKNGFTPFITGGSPKNMCDFPISPRRSASRRQFFF